MDELLVETLESLGYEVFLQGSMAENAQYPDHFFTYWNDAADGTGFYSNQEGAVLWQYSVNFYSKNPLAVSKMFKSLKGKLTAKNVLKAAGFIVTGAGYNVMSDEPTHTGRGITVKYYEKM